MPGAGRQLLAQAQNFIARLRDFPIGRLAGFRVGLGRAVQEGGADARGAQRGDGGIGMGRGGVVVAPVHQGGRAVIDLVQRADQG